MIFSGYRRNFINFIKKYSDYYKDEIPQQMQYSNVGANLNKMFYKFILWRVFSCFSAFLSIRR